MALNTKLAGSGCADIAARMTTEDQDALLQRLDDLEAAGTGRKEAQLIAAQDALQAVLDERKEFQRLLREQHPDLFADDLDAMFDDVLAEEMGKDKAAGKRPLRTVRQSLTSAAKNTGSGLANAIDGLGELFGGKGRLGSGPTFDEETYAKAKPLFLQALQNFKDAVNDIREAMRAIVRMVLDKFGAQVAETMKPYVVRFVKDVQSGSVSLDGKPDLMTPQGKFAVAKEVADFLIGDGSFKSIVEGRKKISEITGQTIEPGTEAAKQADEAIETAVVLAAREIIQAGRQQGRTPQVIYDRLVGLYDRQPNLAVRSSTSVRDQAYSTPVPLAYVASELAGVTPDTKMIESTAGNGMLAIGASTQNATVNELNPKRAEMLRSMGFSPTTENAATAELAPPKSQQAVVINPPFGATKDDQGETIYYQIKPNWETREVDHAIAFKTLETMADNGRAVLIVGGVQAEAEEARRQDYRGQNKRLFYYNLYQDYNVVDHFSLAGDLYSKQGASYPVDVIVIEGRGKSSRNLPAAQLPEIVTSYDQLKEKLNGTRRVEPQGDRGAAGTDRGADQTGQGDGAGVVGGPGRPGDANGTAVNQGRTADGMPAPGTATGGRSGASGASAGQGQPQPANAPESGGTGRGSVPGDGQRRPARPASSAGDNAPAVGGVSVVSGERVGSGLTDRRGEEQETETQVEYQPQSMAASVGTLVPKAMRDSIAASLQRISESIGNIDDYVAEALAMDPETLRTNFSAEQVDALALAIQNAEAGKGFIIGDQTGIGKGRVVAAMIRYALVNEKIPIFVTEKPNLYSDMIRDLDDIGMTDDLALDTPRPKIFITNSSESIPYTLLREKNGEVTETNLTLKAPKTGKALEDMMKSMMDAESLGDYRVIFTTYSQLQTVKGKMTQRMQFVRQFGAANYMIFDESHNAGGAGETQARTREQREAEKKGESLVTGRAAFVRGLVRTAFGTFFSSATYAKRPDVMDLYSSTNMTLAVERPSQLGEAIKNGGVPMQQAVATMLTQDGQYIRRERTFAGVSYDTQETKVDKKTAENMASAMRSILSFSRFKDRLVKEMQKEFDKEGALISEGGRGEKTTVQGANFGSIMHNLIDQMLLSLKVQSAVEHAIKRLKAGEKVVMTVSNTMGSFLKDYAEEMGLNAGDPVALSFRDLYIRYLQKQRIVKIKRPGGQTEEHYLTDEELGPKLTEFYKTIEDQISNAGFGSAPISPIDYLHATLRKAGYKTDEITGRTITLNYERGENPVLVSRTANIRQRVNAVRGFNNGTTDVIILNQAGSTGLSLHASGKFKDQRKRHMVIVQAEKNIDTHMQMLGRVHRTGQVVAPAYSQMMADIPAEMRPAAVLMKKMASLNANTTASRKSAVTAEGVVDFINDYGGQIAQEYLRDNPDVHQALGGNKVVELVDDPAEDATEDDIRRLTGYIPILPIEQQEAIYSDLVDRYNELIERETSLGTNKLEARAVDLDAETLSAVQITEQKQDLSIFAAPAAMEKVDVKRTVKPYTSTEVRQLVEERVGAEITQEINAKFTEKLSERVKKFMDEKIGELESAEKPDKLKIENTRNQITMSSNLVTAVLDNFYIGDSISLKDKNGAVLYGVITDIKNMGRTANPAAGSDWKMSIALANGDAKSITLNFGQLGTRYNLQRETTVQWYNSEKQDLEPMSVWDIFDKGSTLRREKRWIVTGNILAGYSKYRGQIISYTKKDGTTATGVLMSRQFDFEKEQKSQPVRIKDGAMAAKFFEAGINNSSIGTVSGSIRVLLRGGRFMFYTASSKREGGKYFLDKGLTKAIGEDFYKRGSDMVATAYTSAKMADGVDYLINEMEEDIVVRNGADKAREMFAPKPLKNIYVEPGTGMSYSQALKNAGTTESEIKAWRAANKASQRAPRVPAVQQAAQDLFDGKITPAQYREIAAKESPIRPMTSVPKIPTVKEMVSALKPQQVETGVIGLNKQIPAGARTALRLDIPAYDFYNTWVVSIHDGERTGGNAIAYGQTGQISNVDFRSSPRVTLNIARGAESKSTIARMHGDWVPHDSEALAKRAAELLNDPNWVQVGVNPFRHSFFYDKADGMPVVSADEVIQVGPLVLARGVKKTTPEDIRFQVPGTSILFSLSEKTSPHFSAIPEAVRADALSRLKGLEKKREAGKITEAEYRLGVQQLISKLQERNEERTYRRVVTGRKRGADEIIARMRRGVAQGTVLRDEADFAQWLLGENPQLAEGLGISITSKARDNESGDYDPVTSVMRLVTGRASDSTAVHEILHHTERMMPSEVQEGLEREWRRAWDAAYRGADAKLKAAMESMLESALGSEEASKLVTQAFKDGVLKYDQHYQLYSPSEFWAVNGSRILAGRYAAKGSWVKRAAQWFREFVQRVKHMLGARSDYPVIKGMEAVMNGDGAFQYGAQMLVQRDMSGWLAERDMAAPKEPDFQPRFNNIAQRVTNGALNFFARDPRGLKTFGVYSRTLSTQYNKALRDRDFGKVFAYVNAMQNHVSLSSIRPSELAPRILPRVDDFMSSVRGLVKGRKDTKDMEQAANALFAGTLDGESVLQGKVWSDDELRGQFGMTDMGISLYREAREAIDKSLDEVAAAEAYAMAQGFVPKSLRRVIIDDPSQAERLLVQEVKKQQKTLEAAIAAADRLGVEDRKAELEASLKRYQDTQRKIEQIFQTSRMLKVAGYAPLMRFGKYTVTVQAVNEKTGALIRDENGESVVYYYGQFETEAEAKSMRDVQESMYADRDDVRVSAGVKSELAHEMFAGISPETLALFAEAVGAGQAVKTYYQQALSERSALKRRLNRKGIEGYTKDLPRVLSNFITSNGRFAAQRYYLRDLNNAIKYIPKEKGDVLDEAIKLKNFTMDPNDPAAPLSSALFAWFLGGSVAAAVVNLSQPVLMTGPYLSQFGVSKASKAMKMGLAHTLGRKEITDADLKAALKRASQEGIVEAQEIFHLYSLGAQGVATRLVNALSRLPVAGKRLKAGSQDARARVNAFLTLWGSMFSLAESFNRKLTFISAYELARMRNDKNPYAFAVRAVNETQGIYNKVNRPNLGRGAIGRTVLTFKQFSLMYVELLNRMWKMGGPEGKRAALIMLAVLMLAAGEEGLPFAKDLDDLIDTIGQGFGFDTNMARDKRSLAYQILGKTVGDLFLYGISSQLPLDFAGRLGLGNMIPGTGLVKQSNAENRGREIAEIVGPVAGMGGQLGDAYDAFSDGNTGKAVQNLSPKAVKDLIASAEMLKKGYATDARGRKVVETDGTDAAIKAIGFTPTGVAETTRRTMPIQQDIGLQKGVESAIVDEWVRGIIDGDEKMIQSAMKRRDDWNKKNPKTPIVIGPQQIQSRVKTMTRDKDERVLRSAPKEMRQRVNSELVGGE